MNKIRRNLENILSEIPEGVDLVVAAKTRTAEEILQTINAGVKKIGENYVQESLKVIEKIGDKAQWHFIGHLQTNKVKYVVPVYDMIETVDSIKLAKEIDKQAKKNNKIMPVLIEINSGREPQKFGVMPENTEKLIEEISSLPNIKIMGLMTMGPRFGEPEKARPYFKETKKIFDKIKTANIPNVEMKYLSMGMSNSYKIAIEEGANMVRIGTKIFGKRKYI
ncbi:MAG: YggS family pyridoxal phosphate-dependent enzyme [Candidatus Cloacimonetes bacterium]|nr:YggS family pyridoxal phosphate-dependent enzyme [Candidatus Cloacimonadota bacterium]